MLGFSPLKKRNEKAERKSKGGSVLEGTKSAASKSKNYNKNIICNVCGKEVRSDTLERH